LTGKNDVTFKIVVDEENKKIIVDLEVEDDS